MVDEKEPKKRRKAKRVTRTSKSKALTRVLTHPETGEEIYLRENDEYPDIFKYVAKVMFLSGSASVPQISKKLNIPANTLRTWQTRENWTALKREVVRLASQEAVRSSRKAMTNYIVEIDRGANQLLARLNTRLDELDDVNKVKSEADMIRLIYEVLKIKLQIMRILNINTDSRAFTPHPADLELDGLPTTPRSPRFLTMNSAEIIIESIPGHLRNAANFVMGVSDTEVDPALLDALAQHIDEATKNDDDDDDGKAPMLF